jgi:hypothetical protein
MGISGARRLESVVSKQPKEPTGTGDRLEEWSLVDAPPAEKTQRKVPARGADPYNRVAAKEGTSIDRPKARSLDDMRQLSEEIQKASTWVPPPTVATEELLVRMAGLRTKLERCLEQIDALSKAVPQSADRRSEELLTRLKETGRHLQHALDELEPGQLKLKD